MEKKEQPQTIPERMKEGWVDFVRYYTNEGFIDRCICDSINDPNNINKSSLSLNSINTWYRFNNGNWIPGRDMSPRFLEVIVSRERVENSAAYLLAKYRRHFS